MKAHRMKRQLLSVLFVEHHIYNVSVARINGQIQIFMQLETKVGLER